MEAANARTLLRLAGPLWAALSSQSAMLLVNTAFVARLGAAELAALGIGSYAAATASAVLTGIGVAVQVRTARARGSAQARHAPAASRTAAHPLEEGLLIALLSSLAWGAALYLGAGWLFARLHLDPGVSAQASLFFQVRALGFVPMALCAAFRGYWNGRLLPQVNLRIQLVALAVHAACAWLLVTGQGPFPSLGVRGAAISVVAAMTVETVAHVAAARRLARADGLAVRLPSRRALREVLHLSLPAGVEHAFVMAGAATLLWVTGRIGTLELAAGTIALNVFLFSVMLSLAFAQAGMSLIGGALGAREPERAHAWALCTAAVATSASLLLAAPLLAAPGLVPRVLGADADVARAAVSAIRLAGVAIVADASGLVFMHALLAAGRSVPVLATSVSLQWGAALPAAWLVGPVLGWGLASVWATQALHRIVQASLFTWHWHRTHALMSKELAPAPDPLDVAPSARATPPAAQARRS